MLNAVVFLFVVVDVVADVTAAVVVVAVDLAMCFQFSAGANAVDILDADICVF